MALITTNDIVILNGHIAKGKALDTAPIAMLTPAIPSTDWYIRSMSAHNTDGTVVTWKFFLMNYDTHEAIVELKPGAVISELVTLGGSAVITKANNSVNGFAIGVSSGVSTGMATDVSFNFDAVLIRAGDTCNCCGGDNLAEL